MNYLAVLVLLLTTGGCSETTNSTVGNDDSFQVKEIVSGLGVPWGMAFVSDTDLLVTERSGTMKLLNIETGELESVAGVPPVWARGQGGLMDVALSPEYERDGRIYLTYSKPVGDVAATALAWARLENNQLVDVEDLFVSNHQTDSGQHFGSRVVFDGKGHLFLSHGERGNRSSAQDLKDHGGTVLRLNQDGSIPGDNPFAGNADAMPEIWSYGHRNPQGLAYDSKNDRLWAIEHGPRGGDEINLVKPGKNYGWPVISYGKEYMAPVMVGEGTHRKGMEQPVKHYVPSIAPCGMIYYTGEYYPELKGSLLSGALKLTHLNQVKLDDNGNVVSEKRYLGEKNERIRHVVAGPGGKLYLSTDSGKIWELVK